MIKEKVIELKNISKSYKGKNNPINVLIDVNLDFNSGGFYAIMGHSGSGKSTLINILGLIEADYDGTYKLFGEAYSNYCDSELSNLRMKNIGFIFQSFYLNQTLKAYENVMLPMLINRDIERKDRKERAIKLLESVGLKDRIDHFPNELSGGEQQRVAIARALANNPSIILADEPTGNLDEDNAHEIFSRLRELANNGKCVVVVTHSNEVKKYADRIYKFSNKKLVEEE